jgi:uncharacterized protein
VAIAFEWDPRKERTNRRKHGVSFAEARTVFDDHFARIFEDIDHSKVEDREIIVGNCSTGRLLLVSFTEPKPELVRIISARQATRTERKDYEEDN